MDSYDILVIILSATLAILLVISIVFMVYMVKLVKKLREISEKAEHVADNVEAASSFFRKSAGPIAVSKLLANIVEAVSKKKEDK